MYSKVIFIKENMRLVKPYSKEWIFQFIDTHIEWLPINYDCGKIVIHTPGNFKNTKIEVSLDE